MFNLELGPFIRLLRRSSPGTGTGGRGGVQRKKPIPPGQARKEQAPCHSTGAPFFLGEEAQCNQATSRWPGPCGQAGNRLRAHAGNGRAHAQVVRSIGGTVGPLSRRTNLRAVPPGARRDLDRPRVARFRCPHPPWVTSRLSSTRQLKKARIHGGPRIHLRRTVRLCVPSPYLVFLGAVPPGILPRRRPNSCHRFAAHRLHLARPG